jgi:hypothetical protein
VVDQVSLVTCICEFSEREIVNRLAGEEMLAREMSKRTLRT